MTTPAGETASEALGRLKRVGFRELTIFSADGLAVALVAYSRTDDQGTEVLVVRSLSPDVAYAYRIRPAASVVDRVIPPSEVVTVVYAVLSARWQQPRDEGNVTR
jgi:hypothetical protein